MFELGMHGICEGGEVSDGLPYLDHQTGKGQSALCLIRGLAHSFIRQEDPDEEI